MQFSHSQPGCHQPNSPIAGKNFTIPGQGVFDYSYNPAGWTGIWLSFFYSVLGCLWFYYKIFLDPHHFSSLEQTSWALSTSNATTAAWAARPAAVPPPRSSSCDAAARIRIRTSPASTATRSWSWTGEHKHPDRGAVHKAHDHPDRGRGAKVHEHPDRGAVHNVHDHPDRGAVLRCMIIRIAALCQGA